MTYSSATPGELLRLIYEKRASTRLELASITGTSRSTATQRVDALIPSGLILEAGMTTTGGRRATNFSFNDRAGVLLVADMSATRTRTSITDLSAVPLETAEIPLAIESGPETILPEVHKQFAKHLSDLGLTAADVWGIGIGIPGPVEYATGRPVEPPTMPGWHDVDIPGWFADHYPGPILVDQDTNVMALGEHRKNWPDTDPFVLVKIGTGIGSGLISEGRIYRGAQGAAGDIGHMRLKGYKEMPCRCGNIGCVEASAGGWALIRDLNAKGYKLSSTKELLELISSGDPVAKSLMRRAGRIIGEAIAVMVNLLNPSIVAVGGALVSGQDELLAGIKETVYQRSLPLATRNLVIIAAPPDDRSPLIGAAALVAEQALSVEALDERIAKSG